MKRLRLSAFAGALAAAAVCAGSGHASGHEAVMALGDPIAPPAGFVALCEASPADCAGAAASAQTLQAVRTWAARTRWARVFDAAGLTPPPPAMTTKPADDREAIRASKDAARKALRASGRATDKRPALQVAASPIVDTAAPVSTPIRPSLRTLQTINSSINRAIRGATDLDAFGVADVWTAPSGPRPRGDCEDYVLAKRRALIEAGVDPAHLSIALVRTQAGEAHAVLLVATDRGEQVLDNLSPWVMRWDDAPYDWLERQAPGDPLVWVRPASGR